MRKALIVGMCLIAAGCGKKEWRELYVPEGNYTVLMPGTPNRTEQSVSFDAKMVLYESQLDQTHAFATAYAELAVVPSNAPGRSPEENMMEGAKQNLVAQPGTRLIRETPITHQGMNGREFVIERQEGAVHNTMAMRLFFQGNIMIQVLAQIPQGDPLADPKVKKFLSSLRFNVSSPSPAPSVP